MRLNIYFKHNSIKLFRYIPKYYRYYGTIAAVVSGTTIDIYFYEADSDYPDFIMVILSDPEIFMVPDTTVK